MPFDTLTASELLEHLEGVHRLLDVTRVLAAEINLTKVLEIITHEACKALDCDRASLFQYDSKRDELFTLVTTELEISEIRHSLDHGITGHVARTRELANVNDPYQDPRWNRAVDRATGYQTRNILATALTSPRDNRLLGVLQLLNKNHGPFSRFDEQLVLAFSQHAAVALDRAQLVDELHHSQAIETSLNVARDIQRGFMPSRLPEIPGYDVASWWFPNQAIGGDYCDVVPLRDGRIGLVVADVSGHGLGPSLLMASVRAALRALILEHSSPEVLLGMLGHSMADDLQDGRFVTMVLSALDPKRHTVEYANAGHAPAMHYCCATHEFTELETTGMPIGVLDRPEYPQGPPVVMHAGDLLFLCTDGIVESMDAAGEQFGMKRLEAILREHHALPLQELVRYVGACVEQHFEGDYPPDDLTILAVRRK
jgi:sigma-B regulation protein RsbU (phosphoserine phosphatase)